LDQGFTTDAAIYFRQQDFIGEKKIYEKSSSNKRLKNILNELESFEEGDLVVHNEHGIGKFDSVENITIFGNRHDFIKIIYENDDKLYIPVENIDTIKKYGSDDAPLDRLGSVSWQKRKSKIKNRIGEIAKKLIEIAAARKTISIEPIYKDTISNVIVRHPEDNEAIHNDENGLPRHYVPRNDNANTYQKFCSLFPYSETEDQMQAIEEIEKDLEAGHPMDRLICGDVGFGKTEIAMRAAFLVAK
jgi:transcription-repair coupling factor (superfamily II helicase)